MENSRELKIREIKDKGAWEDFLLDCEEKTFLSSWNWGEFNKLMGNKIWRLGICENDKMISVALVIKITAKRGTFLFLPHCPLLYSGNSKSLPRTELVLVRGEILNTLLKELKEIAKKEKTSFIRIAPIWQRNEENIKIFKNLGFRTAPIHIHPEVTWELDITLPEEELLMEMRKTTRYLIRQAQKNRDIEVYQSQNLNDIEIFNKLYQEVVDRHHFVPFSLSYLKNEFLAFSPDNQISLFFGRYKEEVVSSGIFVFWQGIGFYHHGASSIAYPKIPVSYALQWEAIQEAQKRGCRTFNFWGIADQNQKSKIKNQKYEMKKHPWRGLTLFKMGFGGYRKEYVRTQDFPLSNKYWLTFLFEKLRKTKRGL